jgi:hypothetical protein
MKTDFSNRIDVVQRKYVRPLMKEYEYKNAGRYFFQPSTDIIRTLEIQSGWHAPAHSSFTINLGFVFPPIWNIESDKEMPKSPARHNKLVPTRIGHLLPKNGDYWWQVRSQNDVEKVGAEIQSVIVAHAIPFLNRIGSSDDLLRLFEAGSVDLDLSAPRSYVFAAMILHSRGENLRVNEYLTKALDGIEDSSHPFVEYVRSCAQRMNITSGLA